MHILKPDGTLEEISDKKPYVVSLIEAWTHRPKASYEDNDFYALLWKCVALVALGIILSIAAYSMNETYWDSKLAIERIRNGYCQVAVSGVGGAVWQKCQSK